MRPYDRPSIVAAVATFLLSNSLLVAIIVALAHGFRTDFGFVAPSAGVSLGFAQGKTPCRTPTARA